MIRAALRRRIALPVRELAVFLVVAGAIASAGAQEVQGGLRFAHLAADAPLVDVVIDGRAVFRDVAFGDVTGYAPADAGAHEITVVPHRLRRGDGDAGGGEGTRMPARVLEPVTTFVAIVAGGYHTAVLAGFYEPPAEGQELGHLSLSVTPEGTSFRVSGPRGYEADFTGDQLLTGVQPGTYTIMADREGFRSATYEAEVRPRQTTTVSIALQEGEDESDPVERMVEPGSASDTWASLQVQTFEDEFGGIPMAGEAKIRVVHASPTSPSLYLRAEPAAGGESDDAGADGSEDADDGVEPIELETVAYPAAGAFAAVPAGWYALRFGVEGSDRFLVEIESIELRGGAVYTFFLASEPAGSRGRIVPTVDAAIVWDEAEP